MSSAALAMAVQNLNRSATIFESGVAAHAAPLGHFGLFGIHLFSPSLPRSHPLCAPVCAASATSTGVHTAAAGSTNTSVKTELAM